jgi:hypothetical protein
MPSPARNPTKPTIASRGESREIIARRRADALAHNMLLSFPTRRSPCGEIFAHAFSPVLNIANIVWRMTLMSVDLKGNWTDADIAKLIGSVIDDRDWRLEVDANGIANLSDKSANPTGADYDESLHCFLETWMQGTDFVGLSAAADKSLVGKIAAALRENYPAVKATKFVYVQL